MVYNLIINLYYALARMHRQPEHVMTFLLAELGTSGSLDGQQRLVVKGRFAPKNFEGILRRYISKYFYGTCPFVRLFPATVVEAGTLSCPLNSLIYYWFRVLEHMS